MKTPPRGRLIKCKEGTCYNIGFPLGNSPANQNQKVVQDGARLTRAFGVCVEFK